MCVSDNCPFVRGCRLKVSNLGDVNDDYEGRNAMQRIYVFILVCLNEKHLVEIFSVYVEILANEETNLTRQLSAFFARNEALLPIEMVNLIETNCNPSAQRPSFDSTMLSCGLGYLMQIRVKYLQRQIRFSLLF